MASSKQPRIIFVTGTDTGVGKTILTGLLLAHLRLTGHRALAIKPFCSGGRADAELLHDLQTRELTLDEISPFYFKEPLAPLVAARLHRRKISLDEVLVHNCRIAASLINPRIHQSVNPTMLVEGAGGLLAPLGEGFNLLDLIQTLSSTRHPASSKEVIIVVPNQLGCINHTLLTVSALQAVDKKALTVVLMDVLSPRHSTLDTRHNARLLDEVLAPIPVFRVPYLGKNPAFPGAIERVARKLKKTLAEILA